MRRFAREQSLSLVFLGLFLPRSPARRSPAGTTTTTTRSGTPGCADEPPQTIGFGRYLTTSSFAQAVTENWQSEYLQFTLFILLTIWFVQRGSPESKQPGEEGAESDERPGGRARTPSAARRAGRSAGGWRLALYSNSLVLVMAMIWVWSWFAQSVSGWSELQRRTARARAACALLGRLSRFRGLLADDAAELAVGVPRRRLDGGVVDLPAPARVARVQAGGLPARRDVVEG